MTADQLALFAETETPTTFAKGPKGLLLALVRQGLDPDAVPAAARLVLALDARAGEGE
jgi:hypothetical protein